MTDKVYFSHIPDDSWCVGEYATIIAIPRKWWSIKEWRFMNEFLRTHQIYFREEIKLNV